MSDLDLNHLETIASEWIEDIHRAACCLQVTYKEAQEVFSAYFEGFSPRVFADACAYGWTVKSGYPEYITLQQTARVMLGAI